MAYKRKTKDGVRGRPSKLTQANIDLAIKLRDKGFSILEIAEALGIDESTLYFKGTEWEELRKKLNAIKAKQEAEKINKVSAALYDRAVGQKIKIKKEVVTKAGEVVELTEVREIPGDVKAQEFFLINRDPQNWKAQPEENAKVDGSGGVIKIKFED